MKLCQLTWQAEQDVDQVWECIADDNVDAADRVLDRLTEAFQQLADNPGIGHYREELGGTLCRFWLVYSYLIVYLPKSDPLQIVRVVHAARDVQGILGLPAED